MAKNKYLDIRQTFLDLTYHTVPNAKEQEYLSHLLPKSLKKDAYGNMYFRVGGEDTIVMFTAHLDTVGGDTEVTHVFDGDIVKTDGKSVLGADDKAGVAIMLYMIAKGKPGLYYFFHGEESGCIGSRALSKSLETTKNTNPLYKNIQMVVSLDRKDYDSIITHQGGSRCCSDEYADELALRLNSHNGLKYKKDQYGVLTDSDQFTTIYPECTNLSVGYFDQHQVRERQDLGFLERLSDAMCKIDWETLPIKRDPSKVEYRSYGSSYRSNYEWDDDDYYGRGRTSSSNWGRNNTTQSRKKVRNNMVTDWKGNNVSVDDAVWCEFDEQWCLKSEAIWEDIVGFYVLPDKSKYSEPTGPNKSNKPAVDTTNKDKYTKEPAVIEDLPIGTRFYHEQFGEGIVTANKPDDKRVNASFNGVPKVLYFPIAVSVIKI